MPRNPQDPPYTSSLFKEKTRDRYKASIPKPVGQQKGRWIVDIDKDGTIIWNTEESLREEQ